MKLGDKLSFADFNIKLPNTQKSPEPVDFKAVVEANKAFANNFVQSFTSRINNQQPRSTKKGSKASSNIEELRSGAEIVLNNLIDAIKQTKPEQGEVKKDVR